MSETRRATLLTLRGLHCGVTELPDIDTVEHVRPAGEIRDRCLALYAVVAVAFGLDRTAALTWMAKHDLRSFLTAEEESFVSDGVGEQQRFRGPIESLWALAWVLNVVPRIDWTSLCSNDFINSFPDPRSGWIDSAIGSATATVSASQLTQQLDVAYLLHHCHVEAALSGESAPRSVPTDAVIARRRALEWAASSTAWDEVEMDT